MFFPVFQGQGGVKTMTSEDAQSMIESAWEKPWDNFYTNLTPKYGKKHDNLGNCNKEKL